MAIYLEKIQSYLSTIAFLTSVYLFLPPAANANNSGLSCANIFVSTQVSQFDTQMNILTQGTEISPGVFLLGEGKTSTVYRIKSEKKDLIYKEYKWESPLKHDLLAAEFLYNVPKSGWKSAKYTRHSERDLTVVVENIQGVDVLKYYDLINDDSKINFMETYNNWIDQVINDLQKKNDGYHLLQLEISTRSGFRTINATLENLQGVIFNLWIKPDNVLIQKDRQFVIIDPK